MRVIELIIDGFKSYSVRTVISGWDDSFNSITGLNGSGKSNILDAICFVLGITSMTTVRAQNLQDLIYKRGQAGVTKASVTIVFDNSDKSRSPIGYEQSNTVSVTRRILLDGKNKYLVNGHTATQHFISDLFQSVKLNINNPNFLIMQGRITKVLNMKKEEVLGMLEEAAGTRMFEEKREKALRTMTRKEMRVQELQAQLQEEINPKLEKLRQEKRAFLDFQQAQNEVEHLTRLVVAYKYCRYQERLQNSEKDLADKRRLKEHYKQNADKLGQEINYLREDMDKITTARDKELKKGGRYAALDDAVKKHSHEAVRLTTILELKKSGMDEDETGRKQHETAVQQLTAHLEEKTTHHTRLQKQYETANADVQKQTQALERNEELLQTLQTGVASKEGHEGGYQGQLQDARNRASAAATEQEQASLKIAHFTSRIKEDEPRARKAEKDNAALISELDSLRAQAEKLQTTLAQLGIDPGREEAMKQEQNRLQKGIAEINEKADVIRRSVRNLDFSYADPVPNFDRSKVKGLVAQLFTINEQHVEAGTALEICAGGRLYNVVVDHFETASQLLTTVRRSYTFIPLNGIKGGKASAKQVQAAHSKAPGRVELALNLVGYEAELDAAIAYVFGNTLICKDDEAAKTVTFDSEVNMRSVTLDGSVYSSSGTLSGGSAPANSGLLVKLRQLAVLTREADALQESLDQLNTVMDKEKQKLQGSKKMRSELELKTHAIGLAEEQIKNNSSSSIIHAVMEMKEGIEKLKAVIADAKTRQAEANKEAKRIEKDMNDFANNKDSKLVELQTEVESLKKMLSKQSASIKPLYQEMREAMVEAEQCESDLVAAQKQLQEAEEALSAQREELNEVLAQQKSSKEASDTAQAELDDERAKLSGFDNELTSLQKAMQAKSAQVSKEALEGKELEHQIDNYAKEQQKAQQQLSALESTHDWVSDEIDSFGKPGTPYDFQGRGNMADADSKLQKLQERYEAMKKKINPKVMDMEDSVTKTEQRVQHKLRTIIADKKKIEDTIVTLDGYKRDKLHATWAQVNTDFGTIFNELLPGNTARLDAPEGPGKTISDGLEIKVCLGKVWKHSLAELSGGQRSLIALSLIMALLQYSPAPMYILDEVDAALDMSHTQNIGRLIKTRFKGAQFIVVSLKDGMFQNANRIFKAQFVDGTSVVKTLTPADLR